MSHAPTPSNPARGGSSAAISRLRDRRGFSLAETLTAVLISGIIAGVIISRMLVPRGTSEAVAIMQTLYGVSEGLTAYRGTVGRYPAQIDYLVNLPVSGVDLCRRPLPPHFLEEWRGPYLMRPVSSEGVPVGDALLRNTIRREPETGGSAATMFLDLTGVDREIAERVSQAFDGEEGLSGGTIRWVPEQGEIGTLTFAVPIRGC